LNSGQIRQAYDDAGAEITDVWEQQVTETRDATTRSALGRTRATEAQLFSQLSTTRERLEEVAQARDVLDAFVTDAIASGLLPNA
jgi:hypothetical protein